uniref:alpha-N-acetylgalactosaminide alpha-2,6-sialyltransferase n=1 Tax=Monopterus albus TaxID=43700 RepID=A0A3Q3KH75_MONAL
MFSKKQNKKNPTDICCFSTVIFISCLTHTVLLFGMISFCTECVSMPSLKKDVFCMCALFYCISICLQIEASCSLRKAVRNDPVLRTKFRLSVPVLQWAGSFSRSAWEQLKNQAPLYGWKGLPVNGMVHSSFAISLVSLGVRCAVGKNIDSHDFVFRVNGAVIRVFEEDAGRKVSFYGFSTNTTTNYNLILLNIRTYVLCRFQVVEYTDLCLTSYLSILEVSAYGFITRNYAAFSDHYYDSIRRPLMFFANHDPQMGNQLWEALHRKVLRLYQRRGDS